MTTTFQRERAHNVYDEMMPLLHAHYDEIAHYKDIPLDPDRQAYEHAEDAGFLRVFTARRDGVLIGYSIYFVRFNIHYKSSFQAVQDILFLLPQYRHSRVGLRLISYCDEELKAEKVQVVYHHVKQEHNFGPLLEHLGYKLIDLIYGKRLD